VSDSTQLRVGNDVPDDLPYVIELWDGDRVVVESVLARVQSASLAHAVFSASCAEYPSRLVTLRQGARFIRDTGSVASSR
jgi:hypothetical protein